MDGSLFASYLLILLLLTYMLNRRLIISILRGRKEFICRRCKSCCSMIVWLTPEDIALLESSGQSGFYMKNPEYTRHLRKAYGCSYENFMRMKDSKCIFYRLVDGRSACSVYGMRPKVCREFPVKHFHGIRMHDYRCNGFDDGILKYL